MKQGRSPAKQPTLRQGSPQRKKPSALERRVEISRSWQSGIAALQGQEFQTFDAAVTAVVEEIARTLEISTAEREFLHVLLSTDPTVETALRRSLRVRS